MKESKIHYTPEARDLRAGTGFYRELCGTSGRSTADPASITCRRCMFFYLAEQAPWARAFLDELRKTGGAVSTPALAPSRATKPFDGKIEGVSDATADTFREQSIAQEPVRGFLSNVPGGVQPIVDNSGTPGRAVGVECADIAQPAGDAGQVGDGAGGND